jgi:surface antigen
VFEYNSAVQKYVRTFGMFGLATALSGCLSTGLAPQVVAPVAPLKQGTVTSAQLLEPLNGGLISSLGNSLSPAEKQRGLVAEYQALETSFGQAPVIWIGEKSGSTGEVVAGAPYRVGQQDCRPFTHKLTVKKSVSSTSGSACRQANGSWLLLQ